MIKFNSWTMHKHKSTKQEDRDRTYRLALTGDVSAMKTLRDEYGYVVITVRGKQINLRKLW